MAEIRARPVPIELRAFGPSALLDADGQEVSTVLAQPKRLALLAYLLIDTPHGFHRRDRLLGLLWPELDQDRARAALRKSVHGLRQALSDDSIVGRGDDELATNLAILSSDTVAFDRAMEAGQLARALELYRGELLESFYLSECAEFERWLDQRRQHYRSQAATAAWLLAQRHEHDARPTLALEAARRAVALAPLDERVVRKVLLMLVRLGDRAGAAVLYENFRQRLASDLGVEPSPETSAAIDAVRVGRTHRDR
jgi:serine/threonine-protein kinase